MIAPLRTEAGWRTYGPAEIARAKEIVNWRSLGFSLKQAGELLDCDADQLEAMLSAHQGRLEGEARRLGATIEEVHAVDTATALVRLGIGNQGLLARVTNRSVRRLDLRPGERVFAQVKSVTVRH